MTKTEEKDFLLPYLSSQETVGALFCVFRRLSTPQKEEFLWLIQQVYPQLVGILKLLRLVHPDKYKVHT